MLGTIVTLLSGPFGGFASGIIGSGLGAITDYFKNKQDMQQMQLKHDHEARLLKMNIEARGSEMENEALIAQVDAAKEMVTGSYQHDASYGQASKGVVNILKLIRPSLTFFLLVLVGVIYFKATASEQLDIIATVTYLSEVAVTWWFGDRARGKK